MLLNIKTGFKGLTQRPMSDIVILWACLRELPSNVQFVFSDRNATLELARFESNLEFLSTLPWELWKSNDFKRDDARPDKIERYQAEALIHQSLPASALKGIICYAEHRKKEVMQLVEAAGLAVPVYCKSGWYC